MVVIDRLLCSFCYKIMKGESIKKGATINEGELQKEGVNEGKKNTLRRKKMSIEKIIRCVKTKKYVHFEMEKK
jgi:hypothetical protein